MNKREILTPIGVAVVAGGLALGGIGWAAAQTLPDYPACGVPGAMGARHAQMQASLSQALGLTAEELYAELAAGRTVPQIAQERGIDLTTLHQAMQGQHQAMQGQHQA
ncbi:MAG: hypothetical protein HY534_08180, partial [Chloroflexi bacterium]|nr:hypothetical protein [Chloroflexota bacterium]